MDNSGKNSNSGNIEQTAALDAAKAAVSAAKASEEMLEAANSGQSGVVEDSAKNDASANSASSIPVESEIESASGTKKNFFVRFWDSLKANVKNPSYLAMSNAVGMFCALIPVFGQAYICVFFWVLMRKIKSLQFSLTISIAWTVLTNPFTTPFFLYGYYLIGCEMTSRKILSFHEFIVQAEDILENHASWSHMLRNGLDFLVDDVGGPLFWGCALCVLVATPLTYVITYKISQYYKNRRESL